MHVDTREGTMKHTCKKLFVTSTPSILKLVEMAVLVIGMTLFLVSNRCQSLPTFVALYILPIAVCLTFLLVSYGTALMVTVDGRNPFYTPAWVKGDSWLNVFAGLLMVVGSTLTLTWPACSDTPLTTLSVALGYICAILFGCSSAITYLALVQQQENSKTKTKACHMEAKDEGHTTSLATVF